MQHKVFFSIFLLYSSTISAMELTTRNYPSYIQTIPDDLFATAVCSQLNRRARDTLRCTCKKYAKLILSQDELNNNYKEAFDKKDDLKMAHWKGLGGLFPHQEFVHAIKNEHKVLAGRLLEQGKVTIWDVYCKNIEEAVKTSTVDEILSVFTWLLYARRPKTHLSEFSSGYHFANNLKAQYPEVQKIINLFESYKQGEEARKIAERAARERSRTHLFGSPIPWNVPWYVRGDYC